MQSRFVARRLRSGLAVIHAVLAALPMTAVVSASAQTITTIAGGATCDNASALAVSVPPAATAVDSAGNVFVLVSQSHMVCKVATNGAISRVAGNGTEGFSGDGGAATTAQLRYPSGIAVDAGGNLYIADTFNSRIRKVTTAGTISTIAGDGSPTFGGDGGAASAAKLNFPAGIALDGNGNLYFADSANNRIRKIAGGNISTVAGNGTAGFVGDGGAATDAEFRSPWGVAVDSTGANLYIADRLNNRIRKVSGGNISTLAGNGTGGYSGDGGAAASAKLFTPHGVAVDAAGNVYIADTQNNRLRKVAASDGIITTLAGSGAAAFGGDGGPAANAALNYVPDVSIDGNGNLYLSDQHNHRVRKINVADGKIATLAGNGSEGYSGDGGPATSAQLGSYLYVASDAVGNVYISDTNNHRVRKLATDGTITTVAGNGSDGYGGDAGPATAAQLSSPNGIALDGNNNLYIADTNNHRIRKLAANGTISTVAGNGNAGSPGDGGQATAANLMWPAGVAVDSIGNLYIADSGNNRIRKVSTSGYISTVAGDGTWGFGGDGGPAISAQLKQPSGVVVDLSGNLLIADTANNRIRKVTTGGAINAFAGNGAPGWGGDGGPATDAQINIPRGLAIDPIGNVVIAQGYDNRVRKVTADGTISKIAGVGQADFAGDGGPALAALLNQSQSATFDAAGNMYIADSGNRRIRKVTSSLAATTTTLTSSANPSVYGQSITLTATVAGANPAGTVTFADGPSVLCNVVVLNAGKATCSVPASTLDAGSHNLAAAYSGDEANAPGTGALAQTVDKASTSLAITVVAPGSVLVGQSANITSALAVTSPGAGTPDGTITVSDGEVSCSYSTPASNSCSITPISTGAKTLTATYSGDGNFLASTTTSKYLLVNAAPVAGACGADNSQTLLAAPTQLCSAGNAGAITGSGHPWAWTCAGVDGGANATCSATIKTWTVAATAGANGSIAPSSQTVDHGSAATLTVSAQAGYSIQANGCGGNLNGTAYTTAPVTADCSVTATFTAAPRSTTETHLLLTPNPVNANQTVTATVVVSGASQPTAANRSAAAEVLPAAVTGNIVVDGGGRQCTAVLAGNGVGSCTLVYAAPGTYAVTASYSGDAQNAPSTDTANLLVSAAPPSAPTVSAPALSWWTMLVMAAALAALTWRATTKT